jgi:hypothetical protein
MIILWTYVRCASYLFKLIPLYGGYPGARSNIGPVVDWYKQAMADSFNRLGDVALLSPVAVLTLTVITILLCLTISVELCRANRISASPDRPARI